MTTMSEMHAGSGMHAGSEMRAVPPGGRAMLAGATSAGFRADPRFGGIARIAAEQPLPEPVEVPDPLHIAWQEGFAAGHAGAMAEAARRGAADDAAREGLCLSLQRLDRELEEELRMRLRDTVAALCEAAIAPLAVDEDLLARRIATAVSMLSRADDERVIRLHPDDLKLVSPRLAADWDVRPDAALERGALRIECATGGVEDGPANWRRSIAEALRQC